METSKRLLNYLTNYNHIYSKVWQKLDECHFYNKTFKEWAGWCYCPREYVMEILRNDFHLSNDSWTIDGDSFISSDLIYDVAGLGAWRTTQGIYRFHQQVLDSVWTTLVGGDLPTELFYRLPEWCCYIETPGKFFYDQMLLGFFVYLSDNKEQNCTELIILLDYADHLAAIPLLLTKPTIKECVVETFKEFVVTRGDVQPQMYESCPDSFSLPSQINNSLVNTIARELEPIISTILYICTQSSEIPDFDARPRPDYNKRRRRIYSPEQPRVWEVAYRIGAMLELHHHRVEPVLPDSEPFFGEDSQTAQAAKRPHIRRAHWHGYWSGARNSSDRRFDLKWLHSSLVNVKSWSDTIPVIRQVA